MATQEEVKAFIDKVGPLAAQVCKERGYGNAQAWTCVAQACCETGYGTSSIMMGANAILGIKADKGWVQAAKYGGLVYSAKTKECYDGRTYVDIKDTFRAYGSLIDSVRDYFDLIEKPRYVISLSKNSVLECITDIKNGGYATSPTYINTIITIYNSNRERIEKYKVSDNMIEEKPSKSEKMFFNPILNNLQFVQTAIRIATEFKTHYVNGAWGWPMNKNMIERAIREHAYNRGRAAEMRNLTPDTFGFDCICLLKGILWGWCGDVNGVYGGAGYGENGVSDISETNMINYCSKVSNDFSNIEQGEMLYYNVNGNTHAGIYIGDGLAVECTNEWKNGVQITAVLNIVDIGEKAGYNGRRWTKHGKLPYFAYINSTSVKIPESSSNDLSKYTDEELAKMVLDKKFGNNPKRQELLGDRYRAVQDIVNMMVDNAVPPAKYYTVVSGDTLSAIAAKFNTTFQKIAMDNAIPNPNLIYPGQKLVIK